MLKKRIEHFSSLVGVEVNIFDARLKSFDQYSRAFCHNCPKPCDYVKTHLYGCYEAVRWDNKYIYYCPLDLIFIAVPIVDEYSVLTGGVIVGPLVMGEPSDYELDYPLPQMETTKVNNLAEIAAVVFFEMSAIQKGPNTGDFLNIIYRELELLPKFEGYPMQLEKELQSATVSGNEERARECLNRLLGEIFFRSGGDFKVIKARALELIVLLSRSAIDGGADANEIFALNDDYIKSIDRFESIEELSRWLLGIINRFIGYVFEFKDVKHSVTIRKIIAYINGNYMKKITLDDISEHVCMSKSHVSKIFNEETGVSLSAYVNGVRVEKSKILLADASLSIADVAALIGFEDQSYFAKQFKASTGISPKKFREKL